MKQNQFTWNWYPWLLVNLFIPSERSLEPLYYSSFVFATLVYGVIGIDFVDHFLNQGTPAEHKLAETPIGHESVELDSKEHWLSLVSLLIDKRFFFFFLI